jgi:hypothetical protein
LTDPGIRTMGQIALLISYCQSASGRWRPYDRLTWSSTNTQDIECHCQSAHYTTYAKLGAHLLVRAGADTRIARHACGAYCQYDCDHPACQSTLRINGLRTRRRGHTTCAIPAC